MTKFTPKSKLGQGAPSIAAPVIKPSKRNNNTTGQSPVSLRLTEQEKFLLQQWTDEMQQLTQKRLSASKILRGLIHMKDGVNKKKLLDAILENT